MAKVESIIVFAAAVLLTIFSASVSAGTYSDGTGEPNDPHLIATAEDLNDIGNHIEDWDKHFLMVADINLADYTGTQFNIIGNQSNHFTGVFDGNSHTIFNFTYECNDTDYIGIFGYISNQNAAIKDLILINPDINAAGDSDRVGSLVGCLIDGTITNCGLYGGSVSGYWAAGGLVGYNRGTITNCCCTVSVSGYSHTGGLVGYNTYNGTISNCYAISCASGTNFYTGGLVGTNDGTISNCYATGEVLGKDDTAVLVGHNCHGTISNCYATGEVSGDQYTGGLAGHNCYGTISNCYTTASVDGNDYTGGLVGGSGGTVSSSFWDIETGGPDNGIGTPLPTEQIQSESTFTDAGWDFIGTWDIGENQTYPFLRTHPAGDIDHDDIVNFYDFAILADHWLE